jgi:hypothetical protein
VAGLPGESDGEDVGIVVGAAEVDVDLYARERPREATGYREAGEREEWGERSEAWW